MGGHLPASTGASKDEVRRCARCGEASVVLVFEWQHSYSGLKTHQSTRDYRCQACGAKFSLYPRVTSITFIVMGLVLGCAVAPLAFAWVGWSRLRRDKKNPVVAGAPRPVMQFRDGPPVRQCASCGNAAALTGVTRRTSRGLPTGTEYEYACEPCKKAFVIESPWGHGFSVLCAAAMGGVTVAMFLNSETPGWKYGGSGVALMITLFLLAQTGTRLNNRLRYPVID